MRARTVLIYTVVRILAFAVPLTIFLLLGFVEWIAAVLAAIIGLCVSYIFLRRGRMAIADGLAERSRRGREQLPDDQAEDSAVDGTGAGHPSTAPDRDGNAQR